MKGACVAAISRGDQGVPTDGWVLHGLWRDAESILQRYDLIDLAGSVGPTHSACPPGKTYVLG